MAIKSGRVGVAPDQVDAYGRVVASDYLVDQLKEVLPTGVQEMEFITLANGTFTAPEGYAYNPVVVNVTPSAQWTSNGIANGTEPNGNVHLTLNSNIVEYCFYKRPIVNVTAPFVTGVGIRAFQECNSLVSVSLPNATSAGDYAFYKSSVNSISMPKLTGVPAYMCTDCTSLTTFDFSSIVSINNQSSFSGSGLTGVYAPACTGLGSFTASQFKNCSNLVYVRAPRATSVIRSDTFTNCTSLKLLDIGKVTNFGSAGPIITGCVSLEVIISRQNGVVTIGSTAQFNDIQSVVDVYVPSNVMTNYVNANNWSTLYNNNKVRFNPLESSPYAEPDFVYEGVPSSD